MSSRTSLLKECIYIYIHVYEWIHRVIDFLLHNNQQFLNKFIGFKCYKIQHIKKLNVIMTIHYLKLDSFLRATYQILGF